MQQLVETADTDEAEQPNELKKTERPRMQLKQMRRSRPKRKRLLGLKRMMVHSVVEVAASEQQPWMTFGDRWERLVSPMRQKQPERLKEALDEEVAEAEAVKKAEEELLLEEQLSLLARPQRNDSKKRSGRSNQECCLPLKLRRRRKRNLT